jgi:myo-inositol-1(or 4)-monophosphatase
MNLEQQDANYLRIATDAARQAGDLLKRRFGKQLKVDELLSHDIKLALDVECQDLIQDRLLGAFPDHAFYGEEGIAGNQDSEFQWIVDPLDGTVNFFYGIPHFCVSIALRQGQDIITGVIYDPMRDELWQAQRGGTALLNGEPIQVSDRDDIAEAIATVGFSKSRENVETGLPIFESVALRVRKMRMMGSAALEMAYLATGRTDIYLERSISLWDIAAGQLLLELAGGKTILQPSNLDENKFGILASNGRIDLAQEEQALAPS